MNKPALNHIQLLNKAMRTIKLNRRTSFFVDLILKSVILVRPTN